MSELSYVPRPNCRPHGLPDLAPTARNIAVAGQPWVCPVDGRAWVTVVQYSTGAQCNTIWQCIADPGMQSPLLTVLGARAATAALALNATVTVPLVWNGTMPDTAYTVGVIPGPALVNKVSWVEVDGTRSKTGTTIKMTAIAAVVASDVLVTATRYA